MIDRTSVLCSGRAASGAPGAVFGDGPRNCDLRSHSVGTATAADESDQVFELLAGHGKLRLLATANVGNVAVQLGDLVGNTPKGMPDGSRIKEPIGEATKEDALQLGRRPNSPEERG